MHRRDVRHVAIYEALGFTYACGAFGRKLEVVQVRIGAPRDIDAALFEGRSAEYKRDLGTFISQRDLQQLFVRSLECGIGYQPEDDSELLYASDIARLLGGSPGRLGPMEAP